MRKAQANEEKRDVEKSGERGRRGIVGRKTQGGKDGIGGKGVDQKWRRVRKTKKVVKGKKGEDERRTRVKKTRNEYNRTQKERIYI